MDKPEALIVAGGWEGHFPNEIAAIFSSELITAGMSVQIATDLDIFDDLPRLRRLSVLIPVWTGGTLSADRAANVSAAVAGGVAMAGCHGGMCSAFHGCKKWYFVTGGVFVEHPGDMIKYRVNITDHFHPITRDIPDFEVTTEQYYMLVDPAIHVLATTQFPSPGEEGPHGTNGPVNVPVVWTKLWGSGRIFYTSIGHDPQVLTGEPHMAILRRGIRWAVGRL